MEATAVLKRTLPAPDHLVLEGIYEVEGLVVLCVRSNLAPRCPACLSPQVSCHSHYIRRLRDLSWQGRQVQLRFRVRRLRCRNGDCKRKIFAECVPALAAARARESRRLSEVIGLVGYTLGGLPGNRLLKGIGV